MRLPFPNKDTAAVWAAMIPTLLCV